MEVFEQKSLPYHWNLAKRAACYGQLGNRAEAAACWAKVLEARPETKLADVGTDVRYVNQADEERWTQGLLKAGLGD